MDNEIWLPHEMYGKQYMVSSYGRIKSISTITKTGKIVKLKGVILRTMINDRGYEYVNVNIPKHLLEKGSARKRKRPTIHRLVCTLFHPNPENKTQVNHKDLNQLNNHYLNLEWATPKENTVHAHLNGAVKYRFTKEEIISLREEVRLWGLQTVADRLNMKKVRLYSFLVNKRLNHGFSETIKLGLNSRKLILDVNAGVFYYSIKELSDLIKVKPKEICRRLNGERPNNTSYIYV